MPRHRPIPPSSRPIRYPRARAAVLAAAAALLAGCSGAAGAAGEAGFAFVVDDATNDPERPYFHDFGRVTDGDVVEHVYRLRNDAARPLTITDIAPACGCTVPRVHYTGDDGIEVAGKPVHLAEGHVLSVPPGHVAELVLRMDTSSIRTKNAHQLYTTRVTTDSDTTPYFTLETHILVERPFNVVPEKLGLGRIPVSAGGSASVDIVPIAGFGAAVDGLGTVPEGVTAELREEVRQGQTLWVLDARLEPPLSAGDHTESIPVRTRLQDGVAGPTLSVPLTARAVADVQPTPARLILVARPGNPEPPSATVEIASLLPGHRLRVTEALLPPEHRERLAVEFAPSEGDAGERAARWILTLRARSTTFPEPLKGEIRVVLDDPQAGEVRVPYVVHPG